MQRALLSAVIVPSDSYFGFFDLNFNAFRDLLAQFALLA
tara:strand:- start:553 stop:669 length:117 start_codon:yes stop_codon:yes gene_type:complete